MSMSFDGFISILYINIYLFALYQSSHAHVFWLMYNDIV